MSDGEFISLESTPFADDFPKATKEYFEKVKIDMNQDKNLKHLIEEEGAVSDILKSVINNPEVFVNKQLMSCGNSYEKIIDKINTNNSLIIQNMEIPGINKNVLFKSKDGEQLFISLNESGSLAKQGVINVLNNMDRMDIITGVGLIGVQALSYNFLYK